MKDSEVISEGVKEDTWEINFEQGLLRHNVQEKRNEIEKQRRWETDGNRQFFIQLAVVEKIN